MNYVVYYPDIGRYSRPMTYLEAKATARQFDWACIVNLKTAEVVS